MIRILGVDPGTHRVGWGVIEGTAAKQHIVACGCIESPPGTPAIQYLPTIHTTVQNIIHEYQPAVIGIETLLFQKNITTAISVAQARGVILLQAGIDKLIVKELAPNSIKSAVAGTGAANKKDVEHMVGLLLGCDTSKLIDDTTDALAIAIAALVTH